MPTRKKQETQTGTAQTVALQCLSPSNNDLHEQSPGSMPIDPDAGVSRTDYPTGPNFYLVVLSLSLVLALAGLDLNVVATAVPAITDHFHTVADVGWYSAVYRLMTCSFQFLFGKLYKIYRIKTVFLVSITIFLLGSALCASATSSKMFVVGRAVCGLGTAGGISGCFTILTFLLPPPKRPLWTSLLAMVEAIAAISGPLLGGILTQKLSWRWCFWISLPIGFVTLPTVYYFMSIPEDIQKPKRTWKEDIVQLDVVGTLVFVPSVTCLFVVLSWAGVKYPWSDPKVIGLLITFVGLLAIFAYDQYRKQDEAILPPRILKHRTVIAAFIFSLCCNSSLEIIQYYMPTYFQIVRNYPPSKSGYMMLPVIVGGMAGMLVFGSGTSVMGYYTPFMLVASVLMPVAAGLITTWDTTSSLVQIISYSTFVGFATCLGIQAPQSAVQNSLTPSDVPLGIAVILFAHNFGPALAISIAQTMFTEYLVKDFSTVIPGLNASSIENMGLGELKSTMKGQNLQLILVGAEKAVFQTWYLAIGLTCTSMIGSLLMDWRSVKQHRT